MTDDNTKKLMLGVERDIHRHGWDQEPMLAVLHQLTPNSISLQNTGVQVEGNPGAFLQVIGKGHLDQEFLAHALLTSYGKPETFYGLALISEAWGREETDQDSAARRKAKKMIADTDGSYEVRLISVVDVYGRTCAIVRRRGEKPELNEQLIPAGRVFEGLANMVYSAVRLMPDNAAKLAGLDQLRTRLTEKAHMTRMLEEP